MFGDEHAGEYADNYAGDKYGDDKEIFDAPRPRWLRVEDGTPCQSIPHSALYRF